MPEIVLAAINAKWIHPSLALRLLKANLNGLENHCRILEFALRQNEADMVNSILAASPRILGLSVSIWNHKATLFLLKSLFEHWKNALRPWVVLGGPEVSWLPEDAEIFVYADFVIRGEGEELFRELCGKLLEPGISGQANPGISPLNSAPPPITPKTVFISGSLPQISGIASPYDLYSDEDLCRRLVYVESSRGCVFGCDFCLCNAEQKIGNRSLREFPLEAFLIDMDKLLNRMFPVSCHTQPVRAPQRTIKFLDRSFNTNQKRAVEILKFFLDRIKEDKLPLCVHFEMVPFHLSPELRGILSLFPPGSLRLELGIQTFNPVSAAFTSLAGNPRQNAEAERAEKVLEVLTFLREETEAIVHADLIAGLPGEDLDSFGKGFDRLWMAMTSPRSKNHLESMEIQVGILKLLPGTAMARHSHTYGIKWNREPPYEILENSVIPSAEMDRIKNFARFWEILVNRNHFSDQIYRLIPPGKASFGRFMALSDRLLKNFGKNWGIDRNKLHEALMEEG